MLLADTAGQMSNRSRFDTDTGEEQAEFPLFPLSTLVFPGGHLPLRIFELRYTDMITRVMRAESAFGVCLLHSGPEAGSGGVPREVGTSVRVIDFKQLAGGLLGITVRGEQRFRVLGRRLRRDGLWVARIRFLEPVPSVRMPRTYQPLGKMLRDIHGRMRHPPAPQDAHYDDAGWVARRLGELLPLGSDLKQSLLEMSDPVERLERLRSAIGRRNRRKHA